MFLNILRVVIFVFSFNSFASESVSPVSELVPVEPSFVTFIETYCVVCHGKEKERAGLRFDTLFTKVRGQAFYNPENEYIFEDLSDILDVLNLEEMPPKKLKKQPNKIIKQPSAAERKNTINWLTNRVRQLSQSNQTDTSVIRRLNRFEYVNTMRDLLHINTDRYDPAVHFPKDNEVDGFDTVGEQLVFSDYLLKNYMDANLAFLDKAITFREPTPKQKKQLKTRHFNGKNKSVLNQNVWIIKRKNDVLEIGHGTPYAHNIARPYMKTGFPEKGRYTLTLQAGAIHRLTDSTQHFFKGRLHDEPFELGILLSNDKKGLSDKTREHAKTITTIPLTDDSYGEYSVTFTAEKGEYIGFYWANGPGAIGTPAYGRNVKTIWQKMSTLNPNTQGIYDRNRKGNDALEKKRKSINFADFIKVPAIRLKNMMLEGPLDSTWPPKSHQTLFGKELDPTKVDIDSTFKQFAQKAFRRNVTDVEIEPYIKFTQQLMDELNISASPNTHVEKKQKAEEAIKSGLLAILASPQFLYKEEGIEGALNAVQIATRLSYFLWGSMPDNELMALAKTNQLLNPDILKQQTARLIQSPKGIRFTEHFTDTWLQLNKLGSMLPDHNVFSEYYISGLEQKMKQETRLYFNHILKKNLDIADLLDADYTFIEQDLARFYGIEGVTGHQFRKVSLPKHVRRGGLLGQASVLTVTANGIETSPVVRGAWVLNNIFGTPPPPPPPDVEPLEPDLRGTTNIREQLAKHRSVESCENCHKLIDPIGFALEFYDPIGGLRDHYIYVRKFKNSTKIRKGSVIDGKGELPSGEVFNDESELKQILVNNKKDPFLRALTIKLLTYSIGRQPLSSENDMVEGIMLRVKKRGYGLKDLVTEVVLSTAFLNK